MQRMDAFIRRRAMDAKEAILQETPSSSPRLGTRVSGVDGDCDMPDAPPMALASDPNLEKGGDRSLLADSLQFSGASLPDAAMTNMFPNDPGRSRFATESASSPPEKQGADARARAGGHLMRSASKLLGTCLPALLSAHASDTAYGASDGESEFQSDANRAAPSDAASGPRSRKRRHPSGSRDDVFRPAIRQDSYELHLLARIVQSKLTEDDEGDSEREGPAGGGGGTPEASPLGRGGGERLGPLRARMQSISERAFRRKEDMVPVPAALPAKSPRRRFALPSRSCLVGWCLVTHTKSGGSEFVSLANSGRRGPHMTPSASATHSLASLARLNATRTPSRASCDSRRSDVTDGERERTLTDYWEDSGSEVCESPHPDVCLHWQQPPGFNADRTQQAMQSKFWDALGTAGQRTETTTQDANPTAGDCESSRPQGERLARCDDSASDASSNWDERVIRFRQEATVWESGGDFCPVGRCHSTSRAGVLQMDGEGHGRGSPLQAAPSKVDLWASMLAGGMTEQHSPLMLLRRANSDCTESMRHIQRKRHSPKASRAQLVAAFEEQGTVAGGEPTGVLLNTTRVLPCGKTSSGRSTHTLKTAKFVRDVSTMHDLMLTANDFAMPAHSRPRRSRRGGLRGKEDSGAHMPPRKRIAKPESRTQGTLHGTLLETSWRAEREMSLRGQQTETMAFRTAALVVNFIVSLLVRLRRRRGH
eukprot:evm.model.scf_202.3 EVM.evm.TU.scf_202.3   scf_202:14685-18451(-)